MIQIGHRLTKRSERDLAMYYLEMNKSTKVIDYFAIDNALIYTPEMIMDSLTQYWLEWERKNKGRFYVLIKGQGSIWYLHKAQLTYLWMPDEMENEDKDKKKPQP